MSIKANRVDSKVIGHEEVFGLYSDTSLVQWLDTKTDQGFYNKLNDDLSGEVEFSVKEIEEAIKNCVMEERTREKLKVDVRWARANKREYLLYDCF